MKNGVVKTNDKMESVLEGLTRTTVLELAADLGYSTRVEPITLNELYDADEVFLVDDASSVEACVASLSRNTLSRASLTRKTSSSRLLPPLGRRSRYCWHCLNQKRRPNKLSSEGHVGRLW